MALSAGSKVKYLNPETGKWKKGEIHSVRKAEAEGQEFVLAYVIDTGRENEDHKGRPDRQPELIDVKPNEVQPA